MGISPALPLTHHRVDAQITVNWEILIWDEIPRGKLSHAQESYSLYGDTE